MTKEIKILAVSFLLINLIVYLSLSFINLTFSPMWWDYVSRSVFGGVVSLTFAAGVCWILFSPDDK